jgi:hypothetical protein
MTSSLAVAATLAVLLEGIPVGENPAFYVVSYTLSRAQALELSCTLRKDGGLDCKGTQVIVTKGKDGACTVRQWPVHGLPLDRAGEGRWQALIPGRLCTNYSTIYFLERLADRGWQLIVESRQVAAPKDENERRCSSSDAPSREVYVSDTLAGALSCPTLRLSP